MIGRIKHTLRSSWVLAGLTAAVVIAYRHRSRLRAIGSASYRTSKRILSSRITRSIIACYLLWILLLLFTNSFAFEEIFDWQNEDWRRFWGMAILPPVFFAVAYCLYRWTLRTNEDTEIALSKNQTPQ